MFGGCLPSVLSLRPSGAAAPVVINVDMAPAD